MLPKSVPSSKTLVEPVCDGSFPVTMATFDHLTGVRHRDKIDYRAESALEEALNALIFDKERIDSDQVARYLTHALKNVTTRLVTLFNLDDHNLCDFFFSFPRTPRRGSLQLPRITIHYNSSIIFDKLRVKWLMC